MDADELNGEADRPDAGQGRVELVPVLADGRQIGVEAVVEVDGRPRRDVETVRTALAAAAADAGDGLVFVSADLGGVREMSAQLDDVVEVVLAGDVAPTRVVLQVGVDKALAPYVGRSLTGLRRVGMQVAVHEVVPDGTCHCVELAVDLDWVKVHSCVLRTLGTQETDEALRQLVECAHGVEAEPIATGVTNQEQVEHLAELGIHVTQPES